MAIACPNKNEQSWIDLEATYGKQMAWNLYYKNAGNTPTLDQAKLIRINHEKELSSFMFENVKLTTTEKDDLFKTLKYWFIRNMIGSFDTLDKLENVLEDEIDSNTLRTIYENTLLDIFDNIPAEENSRKMEIFVAMIKDHPVDEVTKTNQFLDDFGYDAGYGQGLVYHEFKKQLSNLLSFEVDEDSENEKTKGTEDVKDSYGKEALKQNRKDSFSRGIKLLISGIPKLRDTDLSNEASYVTTQTFGSAQPMDQSTVNNLLLNLFANTPANINDFLDKIYKEKDNNPTINWLFDKIFKHVSVTTNEQGIIINSEIKADDTNLARLSLINKFIQSFANYKYKLNSFVVSNDTDGASIKMQDADTNNLKNRMLKEWDANLIKNFSEGIIDSSNNEVKFNSLNGFLNYIFNKDIPLVDRLTALGAPKLESRMLDSQIELPIRNTKSTLFDVAGQLITGIKLNQNNINSLANLQKMFDPKSKDAILDMHVSVIGVLEHLIPYRNDYDNQLYNIDGNLISSINLNNYQTLLVSKLNAAVDKALKIYPDDIAKNDAKNIWEYVNTEVPEALNLWSSDSIFLDRIIRGNKLSIELLDGMTSIGEQGVHTSALPETDLWSMFINSSLNNLFPALKHADRSMFYGYSFGYGSTDILSNTGKYVPDVNWKDVFKNHLFNYLDTEIKRIRLAQDKNSIGNKMQTYAEQSKNFILFEDILDINNPSNKTEINSLINSYTGFDNLLTNTWVADRFEKWSNQYFAKTIQAANSVGIGEILKTSGIDIKTLDKLYKALDYSGRRKPRNKEFLNEVISIAAAKYFIGAIEQSKLFFGDPALYSIKTKDDILIYDMIKRINMQSSTKMVGIVDDLTNSFLNNLAQSKDYQISFDGVNSFSYKKNFDGGIKELVIDDPKTITRIGEELKQLFGENSAEYKAYINGFEETDGYSIGNIFFAVEGIVRTEGINSGRLEVLKKELQALHSNTDEINALYTIPKDMKAKEYINNVLRPFTQQKFQYLGPNYMTDRDSYINSGIDDNWKNRLGFTAGRKTSYGYLMPSMVKGTVLDQLNRFMLENGIDVIHFSSAAKFGAGKSRKFYSTAKTPEGIEYTTRFNNSPIEDGEIGYLDFRYMGKQQEVSYESKNKVTDSTQGRKTILSGIVENGKVINEELANYLEEYDNIYRDLVMELTNELTKAYELSPVTFNMMNTMKFVNLIRKQAEQRDSPNNIIDAIIDWANSDTTLKYIESLANYQKIQYVLTSIITNNLLILKRPGTMFPQSPSTGWENKARQVIGDKLVASDEYQFYTFDKDENGNIIKVNPCECAIPLPIKYIDGLLNYYNGDVIWNGTEYVKKPDAQRSISKLVDILNEQIEKGSVQHDIVLKGLRIPNQQLSSNDVFRVKKFLNPIYNQTIIVPNEIIVKTGSDYDIDKESLYFPILNNMMMVEDPSKLTKIEKAQQDLLDLEIKMLLHPSRAKRLLTPVIEGSVKQIAKAKQKEIAKQEQNKAVKTINKPATHLFDLGSLIESTLEYVGGKKGVGVVATAITFHKLVERYKITLKPYYYNLDKEVYESTALNNEFLDGVDNFDANGNIIFYNTSNTHNNVTEQIEDVLSSLITSQVDIVKDSYSSVVNIKLNTLNLVCYLVMRGCSTKSIIDFIDNPYVKQFNRIKEINKAQSITASYPKDNESIIELISGTNKKIEALLKEYVKLSDQAFRIKDVKDYISADTKYLKSPEEVWEVNNPLYDKITSVAGIISKEQIDMLADNSLISPFINSRTLINTIYDPLYLTRNPNNTELVNKQSVLTRNGFKHIFNTEVKNKAIKRYNEHFITFLIQNVIKLNYDALRTGPNSLAKRILRAKENPELKDNTLIQQLVAIIDNKLGNNTPNHIDNIKLYFSKLTTSETNNLISNYDDLENIDNELYKDLVYFNLYQAGISNTPYQLNKILSYRGQKLVLDAINSPEIKKLITDENLAIFYDKFFKNNPGLAKKNKNTKAPDPDQSSDYESYLESASFEKSMDYALNPYLLYTKQFTKEGKIVLQDKSGNTIIPEGGINGIDYTIKSTDKVNEKIVELITNYQISEIAEAPNNEAVAKEVKSTEVAQPFTSNLPGPETKINIYDGTGENAELSNFAVRPFESATLTVLQQSLKPGIRNDISNVVFQSVEQAFQFAKLIVASQTKAIENSNIVKDIMNTTDGGKLRSLGKSIKGLDKEFWDKQSSSIMKNLLIESFKQNPQDLAKLLATGNATLTHTQDKGKWGTEFPKLLMEVRNELRSTQPSVSVEREYTPENITTLKPNEVFVFGSNTEGRHGSGAAKTAVDKFGAVYGKAKGLQGQSYAIVTKDLSKGKRSVSLNSIYQQVIDLNDRAKVRDESKFYVTKFGTDLAGFTIEEIKQIWKDIEENYGIADNIILPKEFEVRPTTQPSSSVSTEADTFYNLKEFSDEEKFAILDNIILKGTATTEDNAIDQLNDMLISDRKFAIEFMKSCLT